MKSTAAPHRTAHHRTRHRSHPSGPARRALAALIQCIWKPRIYGREDIPRTGPVILASNHLAAVDTAVLGLLTGRPVSFLAKNEYFAGHGLRERATANFLKRFGCIPVERGNAALAVHSLEAGRKVLSNNGALAIYPEGTRSRDGRLHRGHTGVAALTLMTGATVVPVGLYNTERVQPIGKRLPRLATVTVRYGEPLDFSRYSEMENSPVIRRAVTDEIMYAIAELSGQVYDDTYHARVPT